MYKPLPESVTIKQSGINGLGLFADQDIKQATNLGMTHPEDWRHNFQNTSWRIH